MQHEVEADSRKVWGFFKWRKKNTRNKKKNLWWDGFKAITEKRTYKIIKRERLSTNQEEMQKEVLKLNVSQDDKVTKVSWMLSFIIPSLEVYCL